MRVMRNFHLTAVILTMVVHLSLYVIAYIYHVRIYRICWSTSRTFRLNPRQYFVECDLYNECYMHYAQFVMHALMCWSVLLCDLNLGATYTPANTV